MPRTEACAIKSACRLLLRCSVVSGSACEATLAGSEATLRLHADYKLGEFGPVEFFTASDY